MAINLLRPQYRDLQSSEEQHDEAISYAYQYHHFNFQSQSSPIKENFF